MPSRALLSDTNPRLIEAYQAVRDNPAVVERLLRDFQEQHSKCFYYEERARRHCDVNSRAAQFLYLNRACWNGLYRENLRGEFNVPVGTKERIIFDDDNFSEISNLLKNATIFVSDFEDAIDQTQEGDLLFVDPPYTTAHNMNGFIKYNQRIFQWDDQVRLRNVVGRAASRGVRIVLTNANHESIHQLYRDAERSQEIMRKSIISGKNSARRNTTEIIYYFNI